MLDAIDFGIVLWLVIAAMAGFGEIMSGTLFLLPVVIGAVIAAILAVLGVDTVWVLVVFGTISVASLVWLRKFAVRNDASPSTSRTGSLRYVDATGIVTAEISGSAAGRVRVETESWRALAKADESISAGAQVRVVEVRGNALIVELL